MAEYSVQKVQPKRICDKIYKCYRSFKPYLRKDFNQRCGYCDDLDSYSDGSRAYHIDHFKPHSIPKFLKLKHCYDNLVYACPYCNGAKSNKWEDKNGFIDPCENEYNNHLYRNKKGQICYKTKQGKYIVENLKLSLLRHELLWIIEKLEAQKRELKIRLGSEKSEQRVKILEQFLKIQNIIDDYTGKFKQEI